MKFQNCPGWGKRLGHFLLALAVGVTVAPATAWSQSGGYFQYNVAAGVDNANPADSQEIQAFEDLQPPGAMTTNLVVTGDYGTANLTASVSYGAVQVAAGCSLNRPQTEYGAPGDFAAWIGGYADSSLPLVYFYDTLQITSATLPVGTPVLLQLSSVYDGMVTPAGRIVDPNNSSAGTQASVWASLVNLQWGFANAPATNGPVGGALQTNVLALTINASVGDAVPFVAGVTISAEAYDGDMRSAFSGAISVGVTNVVYVDVLTPGAGYTSASRTVYPALVAAPPALRIQTTANGIILLWPVGGIPFRLRQNPDLTTTNWTASPNVINMSNGTNQVTFSPSGGNLFFQLVYP